MFRFRDKTIEEFRNEVLGFLGKEIILQGGEKVILEEVTNNSVDYLSTMTGVFEFTPNGEFDWNKGVKGIKMYGFMVTISVMDNRGYKTSNTERILVRYEDKNEKQYLATYSDNSILSRDLKSYK